MALGDVEKVVTEEIVDERKLVLDAVRAALSSVICLHPENSDIEVEILLALLARCAISDLANFVLIYQRMYLMTTGHEVLPMIAGSLIKVPVRDLPQVVQSYLHQTGIKRGSIAADGPAEACGIVLDKLWRMKLADTLKLLRRSKDPEATLRSIVEAHDAALQRAAR